LDIYSTTTRQLRPQFGSRSTCRVFTHCVNVTRSIRQRIRLVCFSRAMSYAEASLLTDLTFMRSPTAPGTHPHRRIVLPRDSFRRFRHIPVECAGYSDFASFHKGSYGLTFCIRRSFSLVLHILDLLDTNRQGHRLGITASVLQINGDSNHPKIESGSIKVVLTHG